MIVRMFLVLVLLGGWVGSIRPASAQSIHEVRIEGNKRIETDAIRAVIKVKPGTALDQKRLAQDVKAIFGMGYFKDVRASFDREMGKLVFTVVEKTTIREVKFSGNSDEETEDLEKEIQIKAFTYLDQNKIREDIDRLKKFYDGKGFYLAEITSEITELPNNEARLTYKIEENRKVQVRRINFLGNRIFSDDQLKKIVQTKEKGFFSFLTSSGSFREEVFAQDRQILKDHYGQQGYIKTKIGQPRVQLSPDKKSLSITVTVEEGDSYTTGNVVLEGELIKDREVLMKSVKLEPGKKVDTVQIQRDISTLSTLYADEGYAYANVIVRDTYDEEKKIVNITYLLQPGQKVWIERIDFKGNVSTKDKVLRREMEIQEGALYHQTKLRESKQNIDRLALYEEVRLSTPRGTADDRVDVVVEVKEKPTGSFSIGAGFNTLESFQIIGQVQKRNVFGTGVNISLDARVGSRTQLFNLQYRDEYFLDTRLGFEVNAFNISRRYTDFDLLSRGVSVGFDYPLYQKALERIRGGVTYNIVDQEISDIRSTVEQLFEGGITSSVTTSLTRDTRNRVFEPSKGSYYRASEEVAGGVFGGANSFSKSELDARWYFPVADESLAPIIGGSVFAFHVNLGYVGPLEDGERVPLFERYFPGGIFTIRGFELRSLGPQIDVATSTDPTGFTTTEFRIGGNKQLVFNAEYIFPIIRPANIKGVLFFDMGNAFDNGENLFTLTGQRQSTGLGIRWFSPIGPLRFEWGFPLDKKKDDSTVVFDFTIGSLF